MNTKTKPMLGCNISGFTLVEIMVALVVVGIGLLGYSTLHVRSVTNNANAFAMTGASNSTSDFIERILRQRYATLVAGNVDPAADGIDNDLDGQIDEVDDGDDGSFLYSIAWTITDYNAATYNNIPPNSKGVTFTITRLANGNQTILNYIKAQLY